MANSEWWTVEDANGTPLASAAGLPNEEAADAAAQAAASQTDGPLFTVRYQRTEATEYQRDVTVTATPLGS